MTQLDLLTFTPKHILGDRDGETYDAMRDRKRLDKQMARIFELMKDGVWRRKEQIVMVTGDDWASAGARLRDLRKPKFGGYQVDRRALGNGAFEYRLLINREDAA